MHVAEPFLTWMVWPVLSPGGMSTSTGGICVPTSRDRSMGLRTPLQASCNRRRDSQQRPDLGEDAPPVSGMLFVWRTRLLLKVKASWCGSVVGNISSLGGGTSGATRCSPRAVQARLSEKVSASPDPSCAARARASKDSTTSAAA
jgi:hypothetical protein